MSTLAAPRLTRLVRGIGKAVVARFGREKFSITQYEAAMLEELAKENLNHPEFRRDIVRHFVRADIAERAKVDPFVVDEKTNKLRPDLFEARRFTRGVIRCGNGMNIRMRDANAMDWMARSLHQQRAAESAQHAATRTTEFLHETDAGVLLIKNPELRTFEAMRQLTLWTDAECDGFEAEDDDDDADA